MCGLQQDPHNICQNGRCKADLREVKSPTAGLRFNDLRHHAVTELAESQASDQTIMAIAGHVSTKMLAHYSHIRIEAKRKALDALSSATNGCGTNSDTTVELVACLIRKSLKQMVGPWGLEPQTSSVSRTRSNQLSYGPESKLA